MKWNEKGYVNVCLCIAILIVFCAKTFTVSVTDNSNDNNNNDNDNAHATTLEDFGEIGKLLKEKKKDAENGLGHNLDDWEKYSGGKKRSNINILWGVPFLRLHSSKLMKDLNINEWNKNLTKSILEIYHLFEKQFAAKLKALSGGDNYKVGQDSDGDINNLFFEWQMNGGYEKYFSHRPEFVIFEDLAQAVYTVYAEGGNFYSIDTMEQRAQRLVDEGTLDNIDDAMNHIRPFPWVTVHNGCMNHLEHDHPESSFSAVYYVQIPEGAGGILIVDPRSKFNEDLKLNPREGEFIMFPSWLRHEVLPTHDCKKPRISIAWNAYGSWEDTKTVLPIPYHDIDLFLERGGHEDLRSYFENPSDEETIIEEIEVDGKLKTEEVSP
jgi:hypothetical protein